MDLYELKAVKAGRGPDARHVSSKHATSHHLLQLCSPPNISTTSPEFQNHYDLLLTVLEAVKAKPARELLEGEPTSKL